MNGEPITVTIAAATRPESCPTSVERVFHRVSHTKLIYPDFDDDNHGGC